MCGCSVEAVNGCECVRIFFPSFYIRFSKITNQIHIKWVCLLPKKITKWIFLLWWFKVQREIQLWKILKHFATKSHKMCWNLLLAINFLKFLQFLCARKKKKIPKLLQIKWLAKLIVESYWKRSQVNSCRFYFTCHFKQWIQWWITN